MIEQSAVSENFRLFFISRRRLLKSDQTIGDAHSKISIFSAATDGG
jgi:hypothetical protein